MNDIGLMYRKLGEYDLALTNHTELLAMRRQIHRDKPHKDVCDSLQALSRTHRLLRDYPSAILYGQQAYSMQLAVLK